MTKKYLELGADPRSKTDFGQNSLHLAAKSSMFSILLLLVNLHGLNLHAVDNDGLTPLQLAIQSNHEEMALLILSLSKQSDDSRARTLGMAVRTGSYRITRHLLVHNRYESFEIIETSKKCENKDIEKLLVR
jgi:ankyrin repeat protein